MKPRTVMQACNAVLEEGDMRIDNGEIEVIDQEFVKQVLKDRTFLETQDD